MDSGLVANWVTATTAVIGVAGAGITAWRRSRVIAWRFERVGQDGIRLRNMGARRAHDVRVVVGDWDGAQGDLPDGVTIEPAQSYGFLLAGTLASGELPGELRVTWRTRPTGILVRLPEQGETVSGSSRR